MSEPQPTIIQLPEKAFVRSDAGYEFPPGEKLPYKLTAQRQAAAGNMGLRFGLVDESDIFTITVETLKDEKKVKQDLQFYKQLFSDVIMVIWLCTVPESRVMKALRKPDEALSEAFRWADEQKITLTSEQYYQAAAAFFQMMQDITVSTAIPDSVKSRTAGHDDPNE